MDGDKKETTKEEVKKTTTKKTTPKKETIKEEKVVEEVKEEQETENKKEEPKQKNIETKETMFGINKSAELVLVYIISILGLIFSITNDKNISKEMKFHYNQAATIWIVSICINVISQICSQMIGAVSIVCNLLSVLLFVFTIVALIKACNGEKYEIPLISDLSKTIWKED
jgi:uncharacterized membrane protein